MGRTLTFWLIVLIGLALCVMALIAVLPYLVALLVLWFVTTRIQAYLARKDDAALKARVRTNGE